MKQKVIEIKKQELTLEFLKSAFSGDVYKGIEHAKKFYTSCPNKPLKPILKSGHTSEDVKTYAKDLESYEVDFKKYEEDREHYRIIKSEVDSVIEGFIKDESGLNDVVPEKYRAKVWSKAWYDGHYSGYYEVYNCLNRLIEIFE